MDKLDDSARKNLSSLQTKVEEYQKNPDLCAELLPDQWTLLAELQAIYNILHNKSSSTEPSIYSNTCKGVEDKVKDLMTSYTGKDTQVLYQDYVEKYGQAKKALDKL